MKDLGIKITVSGKKALDQLYGERGIKKLVIVGRAIEWVASQDKTLQSVILGQADPVDSLGVLALIKRRLEAEAVDVSSAEDARLDEAAAALESKGSVRKKDRPGRSAGA